MREQSTERSTWRSMICRCYNPRCSRYRTHGGIGIKVCARWLDSYENFLADMGLAILSTSFMPASIRALSFSIIDSACARVSFASGLSIPQSILICEGENNTKQQCFDCHQLKSKKICSPEQFHWSIIGRPGSLRVTPSSGRQKPSSREQC